MVRQGGYTLRFHGQLRMVVATFLTLALTLSLVEPLYADAEAADASTPRGFSRNASYYTRVSSLDYYTADDVTKVTFIVRDSNGKRVTKLVAKDASPVTQTDYKTWRTTDTLTEGSTLIASIKKRGVDRERIEDQTVTLAPAPTLTLGAYDTRKGGATLPVAATVDGEVLDGAQFTARLYADDDDGALASTTAVRTDGTLSAELPLPANLDGDYRVELGLLHGGMVTAEDTPVELMTHRPTVTVKLSQDPPYADEAFEVYATPSAATPIVGVTLSDGARSVEMTPRGDSTFGYAYGSGLPSATYTFAVTVRDELGNTNEQSPGSIEKYLVLREVTSPHDDKGLLPVVAKPRTAVLSTDFKPLVISSRTSDDASDNSDEQARVLGAETKQLKRIVDLRPGEATADIPVDTSSVGWKMFGVPWYLWLTGGASAWGGVFAIRWWFRRG